MTIEEMIAANIEDEGEAIKGYLPLLQALEQEADKEAIDMIAEIIGEEVKHTLMLTAMLKKRKAVIKIEPEGTKEALSFLQENI